MRYKKKKKRFLTKDSLPTRSGRMDLNVSGMLFPLILALLLISEVNSQVRRIEENLSHKKRRVFFLPSDGFVIVEDEM